MAEPGKNERTWFEEGYARPKGAAEQRVEYISITYRSMAADELKRALMQLENLAEDGDSGPVTRTGRKDSTRRSRSASNAGEGQREASSRIAFCLARAVLTRARSHHST